MQKQTAPEAVFSVEEYSSLNFGGPAYDGFAVVSRRVGFSPTIIAVYVSALHAEAAAQRLRDEAG